MDAKLKSKTQEKYFFFHIWADLAGFGFKVWKKCKLAKKYKFLNT